MSRVHSVDRRNCDIVVAVAGQPNVGKSTLFNVLTGGGAHVANWPGTTVSLQAALSTWKNKRICFVDLPGTYGLSASSLEEVIAREFIVDEKPDVVLVLVDSTAPERTIYLAIQVLELTSRVVIALTKTDLMHSKGIHIHIDELSKRIRAPVVPISAIKGIGMQELLDVVAKTAESKSEKRIHVDYGIVEPYIAEIEDLLSKSKALSKYPKRWAAIRLLEGDIELEKLLENAGERNILKNIRIIRESIRRTLGKDPLELTIEARYRFVDSVLGGVIVRVRIKPIESIIDRILKIPILGGIVALLILGIVFFTVFAVNTGFPLNILLTSMGYEELAAIIEEGSLSGIVALLFDSLGTVIYDHLINIGASKFLADLISSGIIGGVGSVLSFLPLILMIFIALSALEDSGLAPRLATALHNTLEKFGLSGRAVYPYMISLGCNVPGVLASRISLESEERLQLIASTPFIPCQARLVVIMALITVAFRSPLMQVSAVISLYVISIFIALITSLIFRRTIMKKKEPPELILELPPLHRPNLKVMWWNSWDLAKHFLKKAGTIILALSIVIWLLSHLSYAGFVEDASKSFIATMGRAIAPFLKPLGIEGEKAWITGTALLTGFVAKELFISTIAILGGYGEEVNIVDVLGITPLQTYAVLLFITLYVPCLATLAAMYTESRSIKLTLILILYMVGIAYVISVMIYTLLSAIAMFI